MERPILFNTEMVKAILEGRKIQTRRIIKQKYVNTHIEYRTDKYGTQLVEMQDDVEGETYGKRPDGSSWHKLLGYMPLSCRYSVGDILWIQETWLMQSMSNVDKTAKILFKAQPNDILAKAYFSKDRYDKFIKFSCKNGWQSPYFMPREAARLFLKVTNVDAERLQDITDIGALTEGVREFAIPDISLNPTNYKVYGDKYHDTAKAAFLDYWDELEYKNDKSRFKISEGYSKYNPWVWVIEFERTEKAG